MPNRRYTDGGIATAGLLNGAQIEYWLGDYERNVKKFHFRFPVVSVIDCKVTRE